MSNEAQDKEKWEPWMKKGVLYRAIEQGRYIRFTYSKKETDEWSVRYAWPKKINKGKLQAEDVTPGKRPGLKYFIVDRITFAEALPDGWTPLSLSDSPASKTLLGQKEEKETALVKCKECGAPITKWAQRCPSCGALGPIRSWARRRYQVGCLLAIALAVLLIILAVADCNGWASRIPEGDNTAISGLTSDDFKPESLLFLGAKIQK